MLMHIRRPEPVPVGRRRGRRPRQGEHRPDSDPHCCQPRCKSTSHASTRLPRRSFSCVMILSTARRLLGNAHSVSTPTAVPNVGQTISCTNAAEIGGRPGSRSSCGLIGVFNSPAPQDLGRALTTSVLSKAACTLAGLVYGQLLVRRLKSWSWTTSHSPQQDIGHNTNSCIVGQNFASVCHAPLA
jgi:hypothetical protein